MSYKRDLSHREDSIATLPPTIQIYLIYGHDTYDLCIYVYVCTILTGSLYMRSGNEFIAISILKIIFTNHYIIIFGAIDEKYFEYRGRF